MIQRREFIAGLGSAAAWPVVAAAQQPAMPVIGYLGAQSANDDYKNITVPFLQGLNETGYVEGQNVADRSSLVPAVTRSRWVLSPASTGRSWPAHDMLSEIDHATLRCSVALNVALRRRQHLGRHRHS
jgi:hypothetical protein